MALTTDLKQTCFDLISNFLVFFNYTCSQCTRLSDLSLCDFITKYINGYEPGFLFINCFIQSKLSAIFNRIIGQGKLIKLKRKLCQINPPITCFCHIYIFLTTLCNIDLRCISMSQNMFSSSSGITYIISSGIFIHLYISKLIGQASILPDRMEPCGCRNKIQYVISDNLIHYQENNIQLQPFSSS